MKKIPEKYSLLVTSASMAVMVGTIMSGIITFINIGFVDNFLQLWLKAFAIVFPIALPVVFFLFPVAQKIADKLTE